MYTLNLLFDLNRIDGVFSGDRPGGVLMKSNNWLKLAAQDPPGLNPETAAWENLGGAGSLLIPQAAGHVICVRVAPDPNGPPPAANANLSLIVAFGAALSGKQPNASPFTGPAGEIIAAFSATSQMNSPPQAGAPKVAWFFRLGSIAILPIHPNKAHRYEFALGITVTSAGTTRTYGVDPEMDVGL